MILYKKTNLGFSLVSVMLAMGLGGMLFVALGSSLISLSKQLKQIKDSSSASSQPTEPTLADCLEHKDKLDLTEFKIFFEELIKRKNLEVFPVDFRGKDGVIRKAKGTFIDYFMQVMWDGNNHIHYYGDENLSLAPIKRYHFTHIRKIRQKLCEAEMHARGIVDYRCTGDGIIDRRKQSP